MGPLYGEDMRKIEHLLQKDSMVKAHQRQAHEIWGTRLI
jgi:hypothetical protein